MRTLTRTTDPHNTVNSSGTISAWGNPSESLTWQVFWVWIQWKALSFTMRKNHRQLWLPWKWEIDDSSSEAYESNPATCTADIKYDMKDVFKSVFSLNQHHLIWFDLIWFTSVFSVTKSGKKTEDRILPTWTVTETFILFLFKRRVPLSNCCFRVHHIRHEETHRRVQVVRSTYQSEHSSTATWTEGLTPSGLPAHIQNGCAH